MRSTAHLTKEQMRELLFRKPTPEEVAERQRANREAAWLFALNLHLLEKEAAEEPGE